MKKKHFGFIEMIGSIILLSLDLDRRGNKKYLNEKYIALNKVVGIVVLLFLLIIIFYFLIRYIK